MNYYSNIPKHLELWLRGDKLNYRARGEKFDPDELDLLKSNKEFFKTILKNTESESIKVLPLTPNQKALWFLHVVNPGIVSYNISLAAEVRNHLSADAIHEAFTILTDRHLLLRTIFADLPDSDEMVCQIVLNKLSPVIEKIDCTNYSDKQVRDLLSEKNKIPFNLKSGPLFKVIIVYTSNSVFLNFVFHHIICDAISLRNLFNEFIEIYDSLVCNKMYNSGMKSQGLDYCDFVFSQLDFLSSDRCEKQLEFWLKYLKGGNFELNLPVRHDRPLMQQFNGSTLLFRINGDKYLQLRRMASKYKVTFNVLLLSAFEFFISKISGQSEFYVGLPAAARTDKQFENTFGYFMNVLPLVCSLSGQKSFVDFLDENKIRLSESLENQEVPFPVLVERISPKRDLSRTPILQLIFNYLNRKSLGCLMHFLGDSEKLEYKAWGSLEVKPFNICDQEGQIDLSMEIIDDDSQILCSLKYDSDLFDNESASQFKDEFLKITDLILSDQYLTPVWLSDIKTVKPEKPLIHLNLTGTFTIEPIKPILEFWLQKFDLNSSITFTGYNQVFYQLLDTKSEFNTNTDGYNILIIRFEDWLVNKKSESSISDLSQKVNEFKDSLKGSIRTNPKGKYILAICPPSPGILENRNISVALKEAGEKLSDILRSESNVIVLNSTELVGTYGISNYYEELGEEVGHIPFTEEFLISLATLIARKLYIYIKTPVKVIAVDCDNTLWKGIVAEDSFTGVTIRSEHKILQDFLLEQYNSGILICLCSKNRAEDVFEVFEKNDQMILKREHISFHRINWNPKSENLVELAREINIGLDTFVFIDNDPMECAEVRNNLPEVLTIQVPEAGFSEKDLKNSWIFDNSRITEEDRTRVKKYREEITRSDFRSTVGSFKEFIEGLNLKINIDKFQDDQIPRISQLTFRTNQFNFTAIRKDETEIKCISEDINFECYQVSLKDRFGDYGLTGVIIANKYEGYSVETFLLSCRVLGKGVEHAILSFLGERAKLNNSGYVSLNFRKTARNIPAGKFILSNFGDLEPVINNELQTIDIPVERAIGLTFNPECKTSEIIEAGTGKVNGFNKIPGHKRNDFYHMILEKYLSLDTISAELNKTHSLIYRAEPKDKIRTQTEQIVREVFRQVLKREYFRLDDNFFDIGGHSVLIPPIVNKLFKLYKIKINIADIFQFPTVKELSAFIDGNTDNLKHKPLPEKEVARYLSSGHNIAIIGMVGRFPGANNIDEFWQVISEGKEAITYYSKEELLAKGVNKDLIENKNYVWANGKIDSAEFFDSEFFGIASKDADYMDPQHRVFLEDCYSALENAGYTPENYQGEIGVFAGCGMNNYLLKNLFQQQEALISIGEFQTVINNNSDYLTTRVSYKLNLTGPSLDIQTACSSSLVAIHVACQNLISHSCDMALAGGVFIHLPHAEGYMYEPGGILSPDGHCRPFDSGANGTLFGEGSGVVVLKRLDDAVRDRDTILSVIKGTAVNNDGSNKVGYMAPSVNGQASVIKKAFSESNVRPEMISYIEAHGTGTKLGDLVEFNALKEVFKNSSLTKNTCPIGSVKANIGHLDAAAGVTSVIKVTQMLKKRKLVPLVNFSKPNKTLSLSDSPFYINTSLKDWTRGQNPLCAGISSFGIGGTNVHCILEEAPETIKYDSDRTYHLVPVSARTSNGLVALKERILQHIETNRRDIADIAFTLQQGRKHYEHRSLLICRTEPDKSTHVKLLSAVPTGVQVLSDPELIFAYTGEGSQYTGMTKDLYTGFPEFRKIMNEADYYLKSNFNIDLVKYILRDPDKDNPDEINQTSIAQPLLFTIQYALTCLLREFGLNPDALMGHCIGEYTAACVSGVFNFNDALKLVAMRGKLMQEQKPVPGAFKEILKTVKYGKVNLPVISNLTGKRIDTRELTRDEYWINQINSSITFEGCVKELLKESNSYIIEVGPGNPIATLLSQYSSNGNRIRITSTTRQPNVKLNDIEVFFNAIGQAWAAGVNVDWDIFYKNEKRYRVPLPTYPFERRKHWIDPVTSFNYFNNSTIKSQ